MIRMGYILGKVMKEMSMDEWSEWQSHHARIQIPCISSYCKSDVKNQKAAMGTVKIHALFTALRKGKD